MKIRSIILSAVAPFAAVLLLAGCGGGGNPTGDTSTAAASVSSANGDAITITGDDRMQFGITEFTVAAGSEVTIIFNNTGSMPKEAMGHNLVVLDQSVDAMAFATASTGHAQNGYVSPDYQDRVLAFTQVLGPGESETITFTAPDEPGDYPFVCSFPGHTPAGMRGIMKVE